MLNLYYWETEDLMTAAFSCKHGKFGLSFPISKNAVRKDMDKRKLIGRVTETMDAVLHHGKEILEKGTIDPIKLNDAEARRHYLDKNWKETLANFYVRLEVKEVSEKQAKALELI